MHLPPSLETPPDLNRLALTFRNRLIRVLDYDSISPAFGTFSWMAQCRRRMRYPLDFSERSGLPAFEYGWKAFNSLYGAIPSEVERGKIKECLNLYLPNGTDFVIAARDNILLVCNDVLSEDFDHGIRDKDVRRIIRKATNTSKAIMENLDKHAYHEIPEQLSMLFYEFRNARVHGDYFIAGSQRERIISGETQVLEVTFNFRAFPPVILEMLFWLMGNRTKLTRMDMEAVVDAFVYNSMLEIKKTVTDEWSDEEISELGMALLKFW